MPSMFSKRHYEAIASILRGTRPDEKWQTFQGPFATWERVFSQLTALFEADNPRFDRRKFEEACER